MRKAVYMDNSATTMVSDEALAAMLPLFRESYGNPSALYDMGRAAFKALEDARASVAASLGALKSEIFFTSGGTESDNWAIAGAADAAEAAALRSCLGGRGETAGPAPGGAGGRGKFHMITSAVEHSAVLKPLQRLERRGWEVTVLPTDRTGAVSPDALEAAIRPDTALVSVMAANNVVGTVQDVKALAGVCRRRRVLFHTDAVQAAGHMPLNVRDWDADMVSVSSHKFHGPKGTGALFCKVPRRPDPLVLGGGQERGGRSGTENVHGACGMAAALAAAVRGMDADSARLRSMRDRIIEGALKIPGVLLTGDPRRRLPGHASFVVEGIRHSALLITMLNERGVCASSGSACTVASKEADHVLQALGYGWEPFASLRLTLSVYNTDEEVEHVLDVLPECVAELRRREPLGASGALVRGDGELANRERLKAAGKQDWRG
ncbi:MAG: cysteine desulfurase [Deltaproteobacteria bacterium]|jgi:cysteine desulfurase|nr:cysteine desulfurase [Deltaproteobacteria bacterium]